MIHRSATHVLVLIALFVSKGAPELLAQEAAPSSSETVKVPEGHKVFIYRVSASPGIELSRGGTTIVHQGSTSDEPAVEIEKLLRDAGKTARGDCSPVLMVGSASRASELFAPSDPLVKQVDRLQVWVLNPAVFVGSSAGPAVLQTLLRALHVNNARGVTQVVYARELASPGGLLVAELVQGLEIPVYRYDPAEGAVFLEVLRPEGILLSGLPGFPFVSDRPASELARQVNKEKDSAEEQGDAVRLRHLEEQELEELARRLAEAKGKGLKSVARAPHLRRLLLEAEKKEVEARRALLGELLRREIPLLVMIDRETGVATPRQWPGVGMALPVYPDHASLKRTASDLGIPLGSFAVREMSASALLSWMGEQRSAVAINTFRDDESPLYIFLQAETVRALSEGKMPRWLEE